MLLSPCVEASDNFPGLFQFLGPWIGREPCSKLEGRSSRPRQKRAQADAARAAAVRFSEAALKLRDAALDFGYPFGGRLGSCPAGQHPTEGDYHEGDSRYPEYCGSNPHKEILSHATHSERLEP